MEIALHLFSPQYQLYGNGSDSYAGIIAVGKNWTYYIGFFFTSLRYGANCGSVTEQGITYYNGSLTSMLTGLLNLLEDPDPRDYVNYRWKI